MTRKVTPYRVDHLSSDNFQTQEFALDETIKENKLRRQLSRQFVVHVITQHPENSKLYREALQQIDNGKTEISYDFKFNGARHFGKRVPLLFNVRLSKLDKVSDYLIVVNWKIDLEVPDDVTNALTTPEEVANRDTKFKGFLVFNLNNHLTNVRENFICEILKLPLRFKYDIYEWRELVLLTCYAANYKKVKRKVNHLVELVKFKVDHAGWGTFIRDQVALVFKMLITGKFLTAHCPLLTS
ncbi:hypothetical protein [Mycoplasma sp. ATU-Cv-508]|uniref:hypothetical protein n=1 Tax=Mycoplasma sp. ATU-Cv-508 TaxID=2048001 RepID=UPI000FDE51B0